MSRMARVVAVGLPHHITQRGNFQQDVFLSPDDRKRYLRWMRKFSTQYGLRIFAYCLMQNHVHFIATPTNEDSLARTFKNAHMRYAQYFNKKLGRHGHLWQGRFYSCVLDAPHLILAARYIERNPVRAGLVKKPWQWEWSSALNHVGKEDKAPLKLGDFLGIIGMSHDYWAQYIDSTEETNFLQQIKKHTLAGRPLGKAAFVATLEGKLHRRLSVSPIGRPKKEK